MRTALVVAVAVGLAMGVAPAGAQDFGDGQGEMEPPEWAGEVVASSTDDDPVAPPVTAGESAPPVENDPIEPATVAFPDTGRSRLTLGEESSRSVAGGILSGSTDAAGGD